MPSLYISTRTIPEKNTAKRVYERRQKCEEEVDYIRFLYRRYELINRQDVFFRLDQMRKSRPNIRQTYRRSQKCEEEADYIRILHIQLGSAC